MLPLLPLVIGLVPSLTKWLFGQSAADTVTAVTQAVHDVTGSADPAVAAAALAGNPAMVSSLTVQLAQIAAAREAAADAAHQAELVAKLTDVASARAQTVSLAGSRSPIAWGAPIVSFIVLGTFGAMLGVVLSRSVPAGSEALANIMLGTLAAMSTSVVAYWVGSSAGSQRKSDQLADSVPMSAVSPASLRLN
jgi:phenylpyruvate tautomerase PptA (4-oxalocrotonate tautomerase family)